MSSLFMKFCMWLCAATFFTGVCILVGLLFYWLVSELGWWGLVLPPFAICFSVGLFGWLLRANDGAYW